MPNFEPIFERALMEIQGVPPEKITAIIEYRNEKRVFVPCGIGMLVAPLFALAMIHNKEFGTSHWRWAAIAFFAVVFVICAGAIVRSVCKMQKMRPLLVAMELMYGDEDA